MEADAGEAKERQDQFRFGPVLEVVQSIRARVAAKALTAVEVVKLLNDHAQEWVTHEVEDSEQPRVPALVLMADGRWSELADVVLPDAPEAFRAEVVEAFYGAAPAGALARYEGGPEDFRFGPILAGVRQLRATAPAMGADKIAARILSLVIDGIAAKELVPALRLFADARWADLVDAILLVKNRENRELNEAVVGELRTLVLNDKEDWAARRDAIYARSGKPIMPGGAIVPSFKTPTLAPAYGATVMGDRVHTMNAQAQARIAVEKMVEESRAARQLGRGADQLKLGAGKKDPLEAIATAQATADVMELLTQHAPPAVLAALAIELEDWARARDDDEPEREVYERVSSAIRRALEHAVADGERGNEKAPTKKKKGFLGRIFSGKETE